MKGSAEEVGWSLFPREAGFLDRHHDEKTGPKWVCRRESIYPPCPIAVPQTRCKKHGMPVQPQSYFFALWDNFAKSAVMQLLLAEYQGTVIGGMILLASGTTIRYAYGASDEHYLNLAPNNLLMWTAIKLGCTQGYQTLDMGRTACDNQGLMEFKRRWGTIKEPLPYYYYPQMAGLASTSENSWKFRLLTSCWKKLPLAVAGSLGGYLYKHLG